MTAVKGSSGCCMMLALALSPIAQATPEPTFARDIASIVYHKCATCHRPGEAAPFSLLTYEDVKKRAAQIAAVTRSRYMPPWLPEHGYGDFAGELRLTDQDIATISEWVRAGAPQGAADEMPAAPVFTEGWQLGKPDMVLDAASSFDLTPSGRDIYWNFIFTPGITTRRWVRAIEIRPGEPRVVHHANLLVDRAGSAHLHEAAPGKGFPGMDLVITRSAFDPDGNFLFWKPGSRP
ncbi:MAG: cytochrome c, partial [Bryobacterales bacterium]|nr:cytochrome c [Bryobacterales bacterium]